MSEDGAQQPRKTRGSRACVQCRKGKNRCVVTEGTEGPCERCRAQGLVCVFEPRPQRHQGVDEERLDRIEDSVFALTNAVSQLVQAQQFQAMHQIPANHNHVAVQQPHLPFALPAIPVHPQPAQTQLRAQPSSSQSQSQSQTQKRRRSEAFPELPGFKAPPHPTLRYGIADSTAPSSDDEEMLSSTQLTAPFEALAEAAAAASMASNASSAGTPMSNANQANQATAPTATRSTQHKNRKKLRAAPPPNAFPSVVQKGLVPDEVARRMFQFYIDNMHKVFPILDPGYDTFDNLHERSPWSINAILSVAGQRMPEPSLDIIKATEVATDEAHGIARSSLFGPTVRKEGAQAMTILSAWQQNGYLPSGHALRMTLDLNLHRALARMAEARSKPGKASDDDRELLASARIYICAFWLESVLSAGAGRPSAGEPIHNLTSHIAFFLEHPLSIKEDYVMAAQIDLLRLRSEFDKSGPEPGISEGRQAVDHLKTWWRSWDDALSRFFDSQAYERKMLLCSLYATEMALISTALRFQSFTGSEALSGEVRDLVMSARQSAASYIDITLDSQSLRSTMRYCLHSSYANAAYSGLLLLKFARLWPNEDDFPGVVSRCNHLQHLLSGMPGASRFALTIRIALERFATTFNLSYKLQAPQPLSGSRNAGQHHPYGQNRDGSATRSLGSTVQSALGDPSTSGSFAALDPSLIAASGAVQDPGSTGTADPSSPFDMKAFLANDWTTGHGQQYPDWLRTDSTAEQRDWAFDDVLNAGLDGLFLPNWTLQLDTNNEWWSAQ